MTASEPGAARWAARRLAVKDQYRAVADSLGRPMSPFELDGAVERDEYAGPETGNPCGALRYDVRGLLNLVAVLLAAHPTPPPPLDAREAVARDSFEHHMAFTCDCISWDEHQDRALRAALPAATPSPDAGEPWLAQDKRWWPEPDERKRTDEGDETP